jgi:hypothetical protein
LSAFEIISTCKKIPTQPNELFLLPSSHPMSLPKIAKLAPQTTSLFVCDIQERFKSSIWQFPSVISVAGKMVSECDLVFFAILIF